MENNETVTPVPQAKPGKGMAITSFILGMVNTLWIPVLAIISSNISIAHAQVLYALSWAIVAWPVIGLIMGILGIVFASVAKKQGSKSGLRTAGFVMSLIMLIFAALAILFLIIVMAFVGAMYGEIIKSVLKLFGGIIILML